MAQAVNQVAPPTYDANTIVERKSVDSANPPSYSISASRDVASDTTPADKLIIPTASLSLSSSFPYHPSLSALGIPSSDWATFTSELQAATAPTAGQKTLALLGGLGVACVTGCPWPAICFGRWVLRRQVAGVVKRGLDEPSEAAGCHRESVGAVLKRWNAVWADKKVVVGLEVFVKGVNIDVVTMAEEYKSLKERHGGCHQKKSRCEERRKNCCRTETRGGCQKGESVEKEDCCGKNRRHFILVVEKVENVAGDQVTEAKPWLNVVEKELGYWTMG